MGPKNLLSLMELVSARCRRWLNISADRLPNALCPSSSYPGTAWPDSLTDDQEILGVTLLCCLGEVIGTGDNGNAIDYDDPIVGDSVLVINEGGYSRVCKEGRGGVLCGPLAFIGDSLYLYPSSKGRQQSPLR